MNASQTSIQFSYRRITQSDQMKLENKKIKI